MGQSQITIEEVLNDPNRVDEFISNQEQFILRSAARASGRFITKSDDEWAIALEGFLKAVQKFDESRGGFFSFAEMVIHNNIVDHFRIEQKHSTEGLTDAIDEIAVLPKTGLEIREEIVVLSETLSAYGIRFKDLAECSPKAEKTKRACAQAIRGLLQQEAWRRDMQLTKRLPIAKLQHNTTIPRKILERHRKYIIAVTEILDGDYVYLTEYVKYIKEGIR